MNGLNCPQHRSSGVLLVVALVCVAGAVAIAFAMPLPAKTDERVACAARGEQLLPRAEAPTCEARK